MPSQVKTFALRPQEKSRSSVRKRGRCASHSMFSVPRDSRLSRRYGRLPSARKILENQIRNLPWSSGAASQSRILGKQAQEITE